MQLIEYVPEYKEDFIRFNKDWILDNFGFLESEDVKTFENIDEELANGAMIYFATENGAALACCMAKPLNNDVWEICKLASDKTRPHKGCGSAVFSASIQWAVDHGAKKLFIVSNSKLKAAIHIYRKFGFNEIKLDDYEYIRGDIAFEKIIDRQAEQNK